MRTRPATRIRERFSELRAAGRKAFVPYLTVGDPSLSLSRDLAFMLEDSGADVLELGLPFTDPIADGPINQRAAQRALERGVRTEHLIELVADLRSGGFSLPIVLFTYCNPLLQLANSGPLADSLRGIDGILVTDLPPEEAGDHISMCEQAELDTIFLAAPTSPEQRIARLAEDTSGFLYYVSSKGVTGARATLPQGLEAQIEMLRRHCDLPICVGFGISTKASAQRVCEVADGYVIGSALGAVIESAQATGSNPIAAAREFVLSVDPRG